jgi:hypothetical protein
MRVIRAAARVPSLTGHSILQNAHGATDPRRGAPDFEGWRAGEGCRWGVAVGERGDRGCGGGKADVAVLAVNLVAILSFLLSIQVAPLQPQNCCPLPTLERQHTQSTFSHLSSRNQKIGCKPGRARLRPKHVEKLFLSAAQKTSGNLRRKLPT